VFFIFLGWFVVAVLFMVAFDHVMRQQQYAMYAEIARDWFAYANVVYHERVKASGGPGPVFDTDVERLMGHVEYWRNKIPVKYREKHGCP
jgi:hypothetical protein